MSTKPEPKWKAGDKVRVVVTAPANRDEFPIWANAMDCCRGKEGVVLSECWNGTGGLYSYCVQCDGGSAWNYHEDWLEAISPQFRWKVGNKVRVIATRPSNDSGGSGQLVWNPIMDACCGREGEILSGRLDNWDKTAVYVVKVAGDTWNFREDWLEAIPPVRTTPLTTPTWKVGDLVRIMAQPPADKTAYPVWTSEMDSTCGQLGKVLCVQSPLGNPIVYNVQVSAGMIWSYRPEWLTAPWKVGDKARVVAQRPVGVGLDSVPAWTMGMDKFCGQEGTIVQLGAANYPMIRFEGSAWVFRPEWLEDVPAAVPTPTPAPAPAPVPATVPTPAPVLHKQFGRFRAKGCNAPGEDTKFPKYLHNQDTRLFIVKEDIPSLIQAFEEVFGESYTPAGRPHQDKILDLETKLRQLEAEKQELKSDNIILAAEKINYLCLCKEKDEAYKSLTSWVEKAGKEIVELTEENDALGQTIRSLKADTSAQDADHISQAAARNMYERIMRIPWPAGQDLPEDGLRWLTHPEFSLQRTLAQGFSIYPPQRADSLARMVMECAMPDSLIPWSELDSGVAKHTSHTLDHWRGQGRPAIVVTTSVPLKNSLAGVSIETASRPPTFWGRCRKWLRRS